MPPKNRKRKHSRSKAPKAAPSSNLPRNSLFPFCSLEQKASFLAAVADFHSILDEREENIRKTQHNYKDISNSCSSSDAESFNSAMSGTEFPFNAGMSDAEFSFHAVMRGAEFSSNAAPKILSTEYPLVFNHTDSKLVRIEK